MSITISRTSAATKYLTRPAEDSYSIEYAKSGRSKCTECSQNIQNKALRLGINSKWQHWSCVTNRTISNIGSPDKLQGLSALERKDQDMVRQRFAGHGKAPKKKIATIFD